jgi:hypothetical protein
MKFACHHIIQFKGQNALVVVVVVILLLHLARSHWLLSTKSLNIYPYQNRIQESNLQLHSTLLAGVISHANRQLHGACLLQYTLSFP